MESLREELDSDEEFGLVGMGNHLVIRQMSESELIYGIDEYNRILDEERENNQIQPLH